MRQHGALGNTGRAARVLQESQIALLKRHRSEAILPPLVEYGLEADAAFQVPGRHHFLDAANHEIDQHPFQAKSFAH